ncbi:MAG: aminotransferase class V-fold PLP-dependent enzyme [Polyangiaceae bacterium]|nr:aminotransferase class V-fold PLP-dependent enzyme [Polyangiaceae bacterium]
MLAQPAQAAPSIRDDLEEHFRPFREQTVGINQTFASPTGTRRIVYGDWTASGRLYHPIEERLTHTFGPFMGNTHSESSLVGSRMTHAYHEARDILKRHVGADEHDVLLPTGFGMTGAVNKLQRILGLRAPGRLESQIKLSPGERPVVFVTHMEHHSNHTSWLETIADVECIEPTQAGLVDLNNLRERLAAYADRPLKIGAFTACSNVTGVETPYHAMAKIMHEHGGICFVDFAASAPYVPIQMHPADPLEKLDGIVFSPHKFLGGPGASGILIFDSRLYNCEVPDQPGGGTVAWTNPWGGYRYLDDIEQREDGGTPGILQAIRAALAVRLKEIMNVGAMRRRENQLVKTALKGLRSIPGVHILADNIDERLGIFSFYTEGVHYNLMVRVLNDQYGVQVRGGCSCAGTYGHYLLHVDPNRSRRITDLIDGGDLSEKPGWVRLSIHPTTTQAELEFMIEAVRDAATNIDRYRSSYKYSPVTNEFTPAEPFPDGSAEVKGWFALS